MPVTKLRAPADFGALSIEGRSIDIADDGSYHADHRDIATLRSHGFVDWHNHSGGPGDVETMTKPQLVDAVLALTRVDVEKRSEDDLRAALRNSRGAPADADDLLPSENDLDEAAAKLKSEADPITEQRIEAMTRTELFAFLRSRNVGIGPATKDAGLRAAAFSELCRPV